MTNKNISRRSAEAVTPRALALECLRRTDEGGYSNIVTQSLIGAAREAGMSDADVSLALLLTMGVIERRLTLDYIIGQCSSRPLADIDARTLRLLRLGIYQLAYCERIPDHAAVNETVAEARREARGFVNAVLREYQRRLAAGTLAEPERPVSTGGRTYIKYLALKYSVNKSVCRELLAAYGAERTEAILGAFLLPPPLTLRVNTKRTTREELLAELAARGYEAESTSVSPWGIKLGAGGGISELMSGERPEAFAEDESAQLAVWVLAPRPGERILDACAAPGTKSISAALEMEDRGEIVACELHESRLSLIERSAARQGISGIRAVCRDSTLPPEGEEPFDRVLCDVPCSGYGAIRRKPEIRYRAVDETDELPGLQGAILEASASALRTGGVLVYSTCTILPRENEEVVSAFLEKHSEFVPDPFTLPDGTEAAEGMLTLTPDMPFGGDGFFICRLKKIK